VVLAHVFDPVPETHHLARQDAVDRDVHHVEYQQPENQERRDKRYERPAFGPVSVNGNAGEHEADYRAAGVAEKNTGRPFMLEVVRQKSEAAPHDG